MILSYSSNTHITDIILKHITIFLWFFYIYKKWQIDIIKNTERDSKEKHAKDIKIFLKKRKTKGEKRPKRYQNFAEEEKEKKHKKNLSEKQKRKLSECVKEIILKIPYCVPWAICNKLPSQDNKCANFAESNIDKKLRLATIWKKEQLKDDSF